MMSRTYTNPSRSPSRGGMLNTHQRSPGQRGHGRGARSHMRTQAQHPPQTQGQCPGGACPMPSGGQAQFPGCARPAPSTECEGGACEAPSLSDRVQRRDGYSMVLPDEKKRSNIQERMPVFNYASPVEQPALCVPPNNGRRELEAYDQHVEAQKTRQRDAPQYSTTEQRLGGEGLTLEEVRRRQQAQALRAPVMKKMKEQERKNVAKKHEDDEFEKKKDEARKKAERKSARYAEIDLANDLERARVNDDFLNRLAERQNLSEASPPEEAVHSLSLSDDDNNCVAMGRGKGSGDRNRRRSPELPPPGFSTPGAYADGATAVPGSQTRHSYGDASYHPSAKATMGRAGVTISTFDDVANQGIAWCHEHNGPLLCYHDWRLLDPLQREFPEFDVCALWTLLLELDKDTTKVRELLRGS